MLINVSDKKKIEMNSFLKKILVAALVINPFYARADINIAVVAPMGGDYKYFSEELIDGAKIAVDEINNRGGLQGEKVNLVPVDDPCDDVLSLSAVQMMSLNKTDGRIHLVVGPYCSNAADQIADLLAKAEIVQIHPTSISRAYYTQNHPNVIKFAGYKENQVAGLVDLLNKKYNGKKLAVIFDENNAEMKSVADVIQGKYAKNNKESYLLMAPYVNSERSLSEAVQSVISADADLVYIMGSYRNILLIAEQIKDEKNKTVLITDRYYLNKKFIRKVNEISKDSLVLSLSSLKNNPAFASSLVRLRLWGIEPEGLMPYGYLSVKTWANTVNAAKSFKYVRILKHLAGRKTDTGWGKTVFEQGEPKLPAPFTVYHVKNGAYTQLQ